MSSLALRLLAAQAFAQGPNTSLYMWGDNTHGQLGVNATPAYYSWTNLSAGEAHTVAIRSDGLLFAWGNNIFGQLGDNTTVSKNSPVQIGISSWSQISAGAFHTVGIKVDGTLWGWGNNTYNQLNIYTLTNASNPVLISSESWSQISAGGIHNTAIKLDGSLWAWGGNTSGQLGVPNEYTKLSVGLSHWAAIRADGTLWAGGGNGRGQLGDSTTVNKVFSDVPTVQVPGSWTSVLAYGDATMAIRNDNTLWGWGYNDWGNLGQGDTISRSAPVQIASNIVELGTTIFDPSGLHAVWRDSSNRVFAAGANNGGQLGDGTVVARSSPVQVLAQPGLSGFTTASAITNRTLWVWGANTYGQLGLNTSSGNRSSPVQLGTDYWIATASDFYKQYAIKEDYTLWAWGSNGGGLGDNTTIDRSSPVQIPGSWSQVASVGDSTFAFKTDGTLWGWGYNFYGVLLDGTDTTRSSPVQIPGSWSQVANDYYRVVAINTSGIMYAWGLNDKGQLGDGTTVNRSAPVQIGASSWSQVAVTWSTTVALDAVGRLFTWGAGDFGTLGSNTTVSRSSPVQVGTSNWIQVSAREYSVMAIKTDYNLFGWGLNNVGQLGINDTVNRSSPTTTGAGVSWTSVSTDGGTTSAVRLDGTLYAWGSNDFGSIGDNSIVNKSSPVQVLVSSLIKPIKSLGAGSRTMGALDFGNKLYTWGLGSNGGRGDNTTTDKSLPTPTMQDKTWLYLKFGWQSGKGVDTNYKLWSWGINTQGQVGDGTTVNRSSPVQIGNSSWTMLTVSSSLPSVLGVTSDNTLWGWGANTSNVLGLGEATPIARSSPTQIGNFGPVTSIGLGPAQLSLLQANGKVYSLGGTQTLTSLGNNTPVLVPNLNLPYQRMVKVTDSSYAFVSAGKAHTTAITVDNKLFTWGDNSQGKLGDSTFVTRSSPVQVSGSWTKVSAGGSHTLAINSAYSLYSFGSNYSGQLGTNTGSSNPTWTQVHDGGNYILAVRSDNTLWSWGKNTVGQLGDGTTITRSSPVQIAGSWSNITAGQSHTLATKTDGSLYAWGSNVYGQLGLGYDAPKITWKKFALSDSAFGIAQDDTLWAWGYNNQGQLGDGITISRSYPVQLGVEKWDQIAIGQQSVIGKKADGTVWAWGANGSGQLGVNDTVDRSSPVQVQGLPSNITKVFSGASMSAAIGSDNSLYIWGGNSAGGLGDSSVSNRSSPVQVWSMPTKDVTLTVSGVTSGATFVITTDNSLYAIGANSLGTLGDGTTISRSSPVQIAGSWSKIVGADHTLGLRTDGTLWAWGFNGNGQLGLNDTINRSRPELVSAGDSWIAINVFGSTSMAQKLDGTVWVWGNNATAQLGLGDLTSRSAPTQLKGFTAGTDISKMVAFNSTTASIVGLIDQNNVMYMWGANTYGQAGDGTTLARSIPTQVPVYSNVSSPTQVTSGSWSQIAAGGYHSIAVKSDGSLYTWGLNDRGQTASTGLVNVMTWTKVVGDITQSYGIRSDGTLWAWGLNTFGQLGQINTVNRSSPVQIGVDKFTDVAAGDAHALAVTTDGRLFGWGKNDFGQAGAYSWTQLATGNGGFTLAIRSDGGLFTWGNNATGALGDNTTVTRSSPVQVGVDSWSQVFAGAAYSVANRVDGYLFAWGANTDGQLGDGTTISRSAPVQIGVNYPSLAFNGINEYYTMAPNTGLAFATGDWTIEMWIMPTTYPSVGINAAQIYDTRPAGTGSTATYQLLNLSSTGSISYSSGTIVVFGGTAPLNVWTHIAVVRQSSNTKLFINGTQVGSTTPDTTTYIVGASRPVLGTDGNVLNSAGYNFAGYISNLRVAKGVAVYTGNFTVPTSPLQATQTSGTNIQAITAGQTSLLTGQALLDRSGSGVVITPFGTSVTSTLTPFNSLATNQFLRNKKIATGATHTLVITNDDTLWVWGRNVEGQLGQNNTISRSSPVQIAGTWSTVSARDSSVGAINTSGQLYTWGYNQQGQLGLNDTIFRSSPVQVAGSWNTVSAGTQYTLALSNTNLLYGWGLNNAGQLGLAYNDTVSRSSPVQVGTSSWTSIIAGVSSSAALDTQGKLYTWGWNSQGQLGTPPILPATVDGGSSYIRSNGLLYVWGRNDNGQLGLGDTISRSSPVQLGTDSWLMVKSSTADTNVGFRVGIKTNYTLWAWGYNVYGQLGDGTNITRSSPVQIAGSWINVETGYTHTIAQRNDGTLWAWGFNGQSTLGDGTTIDKNSPVQVLTSISNWSQISSHTYHNLALTDDGKIYGWGQNTVGQLLPTPLTFTEIGFASALRADGQLWVWGVNGSGQLGDNTTIGRSSPVQLSGQWKSAAIVNEITAYPASHGIKFDGTLWGWGKNDFGGIGVNDTINRSSPIQVGSDNNWIKVFGTSATKFALKSDYTLYGWGTNSSGEVGDGTTIHRSSPVQIAGSWTKISSDYNVSLGIKIDGTLWAWGFNGSGSLGQADTILRSSPVQIPGSWTTVSTLYRLVTAIRNDGRLFTWGTNSNGSIGDSSTVDKSSPIQIGTSSWSQVTASIGSASAITLDGKLFTWGANPGVAATLRSSPVQLGTSSWTMLSTGYFAMYGVTLDNRLFAWANVNGPSQGDNTVVAKSSPVLTVSTNLNLSSVLVPAFSSPVLINSTSWSQISAGGSFSMAIKTSDRSLWTWGTGADGVLGHGLTTSRSSPVQVGVLSWSMVDGGIQIAGGITTTGGLYTWGYGLQGGLGSTATVSRSAPVQVATSSWSMVSFGGFNNVIGVDTTNRIFTWGTGTYGDVGDGTTVSKSSPVQLSSLETVIYQPTLVNNSSWSQVIAGNQTMLGITSPEPFLYGWGLNSTGQLGDNTTVSRSTPTQTITGPLIIHRSSPVQIASGSWSQVTAGNSFSGAIRSDGMLFMWGNNTSGQVGDSTTLNRSFPIQIGNNSWTEIGSGSSHAVAIDATNVVYAWGNNLFAQLGQGDQQSRSSPVQVTSSSFTHLSSGSNHVVGLIGNAIYGWGDNSFGQLGKTLQTTTWDSVVIGLTSFGLRSNKLYVWGNPYLTTAPGFGDGTTQYRSSPVQIGTTSDNYLLIAQQTGSSNVHMMAYKQDKILYAWGNNVGGQLGDGTTITRSSPVQVALNEPGISKVFVSLSFSGALSSGGTLYTWGLNTNFQLGDNSGISRSTPVQIASNVKDFALSESSGAYIKNDNTLWVWGLNNNGQLGLNDTVNRSSPVQLAGSWSKVVGTTLTLAYIRTDGTIWGAGANTAGQLGDGSTINRSSPVQISTGGIWQDIVSASGGGASFMAKNIDNSIWAWGNNAQGQLGDVSTVSRSQPVQILPSYLNASFTNQTAQYFSVTIGGTLYAWGNNNTGYLGDGTAVSRSAPTQIGNATDVQQKTPALLDNNNYTRVSAGATHTVALRSNGTAWVFGQGTAGQLGQVTNTVHRSSPTQVNAGQSYSTVFGLGLQTRLASDSAMFAMGSNTNGVLGDVTGVSRSSPVQLTSTPQVKYETPLRVGLSSWTTVSAGYSHSVAIRSDGLLFTWGNNLGGAIGDGTTLNRSSPVQIGTSIWSSIAAGNSMTTAIRSDKTLWTWGLNSSGQLGHNTTVSRSSPVQVPGLWVDSEAGNTYTGALAYNGTVWIWGANGSGVLGNNSLVTRSSPVQVGINAYKSLSLSENSITAVDTYSNLDAWGDNLYGQLGNDGSYYSWSQVSGGFSHFMAIRSDNTLWAWGDNTYGQLGTGYTIARSSPIQIGTSSWTSVSAGGTHTVAIRADNTTWIWGLNTNGQLGTSDTISRSSPVQIATTFTYIQAGNLHSLATTSDGTLYAWGSNLNGQLGIYDGVSRSSPTQVPTSVKFNALSAGITFSLGIATDNTLYSWGGNSVGQLGITAAPFTVPGTVTTLNAPGFITSQGKLYGWGSNTYGQIGDNTTVTKISPVQIGTETIWNKIIPTFSNGSIYGFFKTDNTLWLAGLNSSGQLGTNDVVNRSSPVQLSAGVGRSWTSFTFGTSTGIGIKDDGSLWTVGDNIAGQLGDGTVINRSSPVQIGTGSVWTQASAGNGVNGALKNDGTIWTWGSGNLGGLGNGTTVYRSSMVQIGSGYTSLYMSDQGGHAIGTLGQLVVWGWNANGMLGDNTTINKSGLTTIAGSWTQVVGNSFYSRAGIRSDGTLWTWGNNTNGQLGDNTTVSRSSPVQIAGGGSWTVIAAMDSGTYAARRIDGTVWAWGSTPGDNTQNRSSPVQIAGANMMPNTLAEPTQVSTSTWNAISAGTTHSAAIRSDGKLFTWGNNSNGQLGLNLSFSQVSATGNNTIALITQLGYLWKVGLNLYGQIGDGTTIHRSSPVQIGAGSSTKYRKVSAGGAGTLVILNDNTLWGWGNNQGGAVGDNTTVNRSSPVQVSTGSWLQVYTTPDVTEIQRSSYAIRDNGTLWAWGSNATGQLGFNDTVNRSSPVQLGGETWRYITGSLMTTAAIRTDYTLWVWGANAAGKLGVGDTINRSSPVQIPGSWSQVSVASHIVALDTSGRLFTWGFGAAGQLGNLTNVSRSSPVQIGNLSYTSIAAGFSSTAAIDYSNRLYTWGGGPSGIAGNNTTVLRSSPVQIAADKLWSSVEIAGDTATAIENNGRIWGWGNNTWGQFGLNDTVYRSSPVQVSSFSVRYNLSSPTQVGTSSWTSVSAGDLFTAGISNNTLFTWGGSTAGEIMDGSTTSRSSPVQVGGTLSYTMVATLAQTLLAVTNNDPLQGYSMITSGQNTSGGLGDNTVVAKSTATPVLFSIAGNKSNPVQITSDDYSGYYESSPVQVGSDSWSLIAAGENHSLGTKSSGLLFAWGFNQNGQVGDSTTINKSSPVQISTATTWVDVEAGYNHNVVEKSDGSAYTFGSNSDGQLGDGT